MTVRPDDDRQTQFKRQIWTSLAYLGAALIGVWLLQLVVGPLLPRSAEIPYSEFKTKLAAGQITDVTLGTPIEGVMKNPAPKSPQEETSRFTTLPPPDGDPDLLKELGAAHVTYRAKTPPSPIASFIFSWVLPLLVMMGLWSLIGRNLSARAGGGIFGVGKSKATEVTAEEVGVTFKDVGGADEAIGELQEIIQFLKTPQRFAKLGGRIPKGVLLVGPPGTGQDAHREGHRRRSRRPVLRDERIRVRRDVRRRRRGARARSVRARPSRRARDRVHRRD